MKSRLLTILKMLIGWPLSIVALVFVGRIFWNNQTITSQIFHASPVFILMSLTSFLVYFLFRTLFWQKLLEEKGESLSFQDTPFLWSISELQRYIPGNVWSFIGRTNQFAKRGVEKKKILSSLLHEAEFLCLSALILSSLALNFILFGLLPKPFHSHLTVMLLVTVILLLTAFFIAGNHFFRYKKLHILFPHLPVSTSVRLLCLMSIGFFFFGLGNYFAVSAWYPLYLPHLFSLSAFFVFSFLVGYLSFITPMGLGVREAVITEGLRRYIGLTQAGFAAIASRLLLIISELLFLLLSFALMSMNKQLFSRLASFWHAHKYSILLGIAVFVSIAYFTSASFLRYSNYYTGRFDLGNMDQTVWNTAHGRIFQLTDPDGTHIISRLSVHADFLLILLAPLYYIWQDPRMLLLIQAIIVSLGAFFVYGIALHVLKNKQLSLLLGLLFLINPAVNHATLYDFHAVTLATTFLLAAWFFLLKKKLLPFLLFIVLAALTKEEVWIIAGLLSLTYGLINKKKLVGILAGLSSFGLFYYIFFHAIPTTRGANHFALSYYSDFGSTPSGVIKGIFFSPLKTIRTILEKSQLDFLLEILLPLGFLPLLTLPILIFTGPDLAIDLLSQNAQLHSIYYQYTADITPFLFIASIYSIWLLQKRFIKLSQTALIVFLLFFGIGGAYLYGPLPGAIHQNVDMFIKPLWYSDDIDTFLNSIPHKYSVAATNNVGSHLSHRQKIYTIPTGVDKADIVVMLLNDQFAQPSLQAQKEFALKLQHDPNYNEVFRLNDFDVFTRKNVILRPVPKERYNHQPIFPSFK